MQPAAASNESTNKQGTGIAQKDRVPVCQKLAFSIGTNFDWLSTGVLTTILWLQFFNIGLGLDAVWLGVLLVVFRLWDAVTDPVMGYISDNWRLRWGRRRPYIAIGAVGVALIYPMIFRPPESCGATGMLVWVGFFGILLFTAFTCWSMPYYGLQMELTPDYDERTRLSAWMAAFGKLGVFAGGWIMALATCDWFKDPATGEADLVRGMRVVSWFVTAYLLVVGLLPALFVRERVTEVLTGSAPTARLPFWRGIRESMSCRPLWALIAVSFLVVFASAAVGSLGHYANIYYVNGGNLATASKIAGWKSSATVVTGLLCIPLWTWLGERYDKRAMVMFLVGLGMFGHLLNLFMMTPEHPYLQIIPAVFELAGTTSIWIFLPSMKADVADLDELHTGQRREASINAFYAWFFKVALALSMGIGGFMIKLSGYDPANSAAQPPEVVERIFHFFVWTPVPVWLLAMLLLAFYQVNRARMAEVRAQLEARRGVISAA